MQALDLVNAFVSSYLAHHGMPIATRYVCPHERATGCSYTKPNPHFLRRAERDPRIDLRRSFVVGDYPHDVELASNADVTGICVLSGHGRRHRGVFSADRMVAAGINEAAKRIPMLAGRAGGRSRHVTTRPASDAKDRS